MKINECSLLKNECTGCCACQSICPSHAIQMVPDENGFMYPRIDLLLCSDCGMCARVCSINKPLDKNVKYGQLYGYVRNNSDRLLSASGGICAAFAIAVVSSGGVVYGAADTGGKVRHIAATTQSEIESMRGSMYVQSEIGSIYLQAKEQLEADREVLFIGTPCQVYGLRNFLNKEYQNLLTIDFVCHGVPSPRMYADMLKAQGADRATFREKPYGWRNQVIRLYKGNRRIRTIDSQRCFYYLAFVYSYALRLSCYRCQLPEHHAADITVGDYWQAREPGYYGISQIKVNNEHGKAALNGITDKLVLTSIDDEERLVKCFTSHDKLVEYDLQKRDAFYACYQENGYKRVEKSYMRGELRSKKRRIRSVIKYRLSRKAEK